MNQLCTPAANHSLSQINCLSRYYYYCCYFSDFGFLIIIIIVINFLSHSSPDLGSGITKANAVAQISYYVITTVNNTVIIIAKKFEFLTSPIAGHFFD